MLTVLTITVIALGIVVYRQWRAGQRLEAELRRFGTQLFTVSNKVSDLEKRRPQPSAEPPEAIPSPPKIAAERSAPAEAVKSTPLTAPPTPTPAPPVLPTASTPPKSEAVETPGPEKAEPCTPAKPPAPTQPAKPPTSPAPKPTATSKPPATPKPSDGGIVGPPSPPAVPPPTLPPPAPPQKPAPSFNLFAPGWEERFTSRWLVWLGGLAIALAGFFLIKYAAERGWLSPVLRCAAGVILGAAFAAAGEWVRRRPLQIELAALRPDYVPQALTAAGLFIAFASVYLAYALYAILPASVTFAMLGAIALCGFGLSLLQGPYVAILGLIGAMITPGLVETEAPSAWGLFGYLLAITLASAAVLWFRTWWWLGLATVVLNYLWTLLWIGVSFSRTDDIPLFVFVTSVAATYALLSWHRTDNDEPDLLSGGPLMSAQSAAMLASGAGFVCLAFLVAELGYTREAFAGLASAGAGITALVKFRPRFEPLFSFIAVITLVLCAAWTGKHVSVETVLFDTADAKSTAYGRSMFAWTAAMLSVLFAVGGYWCTKGKRPLLLVVPAVLLPLALLLLGYIRFLSSVSDNTWAGISLIYAAAMAVAAARLLPVAQRPSMRIPVGLYASAGALGVSMALAFVLRDAALTVALAGQVLAIAWLSKHADFRVLRLFTLVLATTILIRLTFNPFIFTYADSSALGTQWILYGFGGSACLFYVAAQLFRAKADDEIVMALESAALVFAIMLVTYEIRIWIAGSMNAESYELLEQSVQSISWLASAYALMRRHAVTPRLFTLWGSRLLLLLGGGQVFLLQVLASNPIVTGKPISGEFPADLLALAYLSPAILLWFAARKLSAIGFTEMRDWAVGAAVALVFTYATLEVRHVFQGSLIDFMSISLAELYWTTLVWLVLAVVPMFAGYLRSETAVRYGALALLVLAALSVLGAHAVFQNPALTGEPISGWPVLNLLLLGFAAPAAAFWVAARKSQAMHWEPYRDYFGGLACLFLFIDATLEVRHLFQGDVFTLHHKSLAELYTTTLVWLGLALAPMFIAILRAERGIRYGALAIAGLAALYAVGAHMLIDNPAMTEEPIAGVPVFNLLLLGFAAPAAAFWIAARRSSVMGWELFRDYLTGLVCLLALAYTTLEMRRLFQGEVIAQYHLSLGELYTTTLVWLGLALAPLFIPALRAERGIRYGTLAIAGLAVLYVAGVHMLSDNPAITGEPIAGVPVFNLLLLGIAAPAAITWLAARRFAALHWEPLRDYMIGLACVLIFAYGTLEMRRLFQGQIITLHHATLAELYTTTLAWFALGVLTFGLWRLQREPVARIGAIAMLAISIVTVLAGHVVIFNPIVTGAPVAGWVILNVLILGFVIPAALLLLSARHSNRIGLDKYRDYPVAIAYVLGLAFVTLDVRHWFHNPDLSIGQVLESEDYAYSAIWLVYALSTLIVGMWLKRSLLRYAALAVLVLTVIKVFLWDMSGLGGLYRVASFLGLGLSLVGIGYLYQRYVYPVTKDDGGETKPEEEPSAQPG